MILGFLDLLFEDALERDRIGSKLGDTLSELLHGHRFFVEVKSELGLIIEVLLLFYVESLGILGVQLLGYLFFRVVEILEVVGLRATMSVKSFPSRHGRPTDIVK